MIFFKIFAAFGRVVICKASLLVCLMSQSVFATSFNLFEVSSANYFQESDATHSLSFAWLPNLIESEEALGLGARLGVSYMPKISSGNMLVTSLDVVPRYRLNEKVTFELSAGLDLWEDDAYVEFGSFAVLDTKTWELFSEIRHLVDGIFVGAAYIGPDDVDTYNISFGVRKRL